MSNGPQARGSILGGVLLILLGVLFLFARWNPDLRIWHVFWHYWPVLIILWGVAKLVDHLSAQQEGRTRPPLVTGSEAALMVLVILVIAGMGLYSHIREKHPDMDINMNMFHEQATQNVDVPVKTIPAGSHVTLTTARGNITCHAGDTDELRVNGNETASEANQSAAEDRLKEVRVTIEQTRDGIPGASGESGKRRDGHRGFGYYGAEERVGDREYQSWRYQHLRNIGKSLGHDAAWGGGDS